MPISHNPISARGLLDEANVSAGDWVLLTAAASTVSNLVAAIARRRGVRVMGLVRGDEIAGASRSRADLVFSTRDSDLIGKIMKVAGERGIAALLDSVGGRSLPQLRGTCEALLDNLVREIFLYKTDGGFYVASPTAVDDTDCA